MVSFLCLSSSNSCHRLGVGVIGKLPHWKNYVGVSAEQRPAVGRLTVEIIEALALPSVKQGHGMVDPYVRATITGYDRDFFWFLREWLPRKRFSLCSGYCSSTVSPVWRGCGGCGGERLTLPVISTAGAVLRLEVLHYNVMTNARGKDCVLGIVEIPLSDCEKQVTEVFNANGTFTVTTYDDFDGPCVEDGTISGTWVNSGNGNYTITVFGFPFEVKITFEGNTHSFEYSEDGVDYIDVYVKK